MGKLRTLLMATFCLTAGPLFGQDVRVKVAKEPPPYYIGLPATIQFTVEGFDQKPTPTVEIEDPAQGLRIALLRADPRVSSFMSSINGRVSRSTVVTYVLSYAITADQPGEYLVGPFLIKQGSKQARVDALPMTFQTVPEDPGMRIRLNLPEGNLYPDQRVPVEIEWWYAGDFEEVQKLSIHSPLFDEFRFAPDPEPPRRSSQLPIQTKEGRILLAAEAERQQRDGQEFVVVRATRTLIPDRVGKFPLAPITVTLVKATEWAQERSIFDDFGFGGSLSRRRPAKTELSRATGVPQTLVVKPFPSTGRPESFAGAVGEGFSIDVAADRTVVRVGDPIGLDITLRGNGNLDNASLPPLSADGGMDPDLFRLPEGDVPGHLTDGKKEFHVSVRVSDESAGEIPALAYSWFDPKSETYQTARSKPIALRVMSAQVVSAGDVVSSVTGSSPAASAGADDSGKARQVAAAVSKEPVFSLSGADLAIEPAAGAVLRDQDGRGGIVVQLLLYGAGLLLVAVAFVDRKRRDVDPEWIALRKNVHRQQSRVARAARLPRKEAADEVADAMRALVASLPDVARDETQQVIARCESIVYAPAESGEDRLDKALIEQTKTLAARFQRSATEARS